MENKILLEFGQKMRKIRNMIGISIEELSFRSGISRNYLSDVERGKRNVSLINIEKIARGLNVPTFVLFVD